MVNEIKIVELDWHKSKVLAAPIRGNKVLVSSSIKNNEVYGSYTQTKTRCVWPGSSLNLDSKYLSRKIVAREI